MLACNSDSVASFESSGSSGSITRFATYGDFMYVVNPSEMQTFDISDSANPVFLNKLETENGLETIFIYEGRVYLGSRLGLYIISIEDPAEPTLLSQTLRSDTFFGSCDPVVVQDNFAYATIKIIENVCGNFGTSSALLVYDVSDPEAPVEIQSINLDIPNGLGIKDDHLIVCDTGAGLLRVFDIGNPNNVVAKTDWDYPMADPIDLIVDEERMIVSSNQDFKVLDVSDLSQIGLVKIIERGE